MALAKPSISQSLPAYPLASTVARVRDGLKATPVNPTGFHRDDYLTTLAGIAEHFRRSQASDGRIIDPYVHREVQYSTPCYAGAAAALVASRKQPDLLESAARALDVALQQLAEGKAADGHGDFFTFPAMLAYEQLRDRVAHDRRERWERLLRAIKPRRAYQDVLSEQRPTVHNWNVVALAGEFLRHQAGFTDASFVESSLQAQLAHFTPEGLYCDPNVPMAYDLFPRHFLAVMLGRGYGGRHHRELAELLERAAWTSLMMQSPGGEWPTGGRSAQHQWNEAMQCVTFEAWAARKQREGDPVAARAFKRAAHLALASLRRWVRPSGELWIVKNRFDPARRHGFESYSFHSQYNLLAASMLATAWLFADDAIPEGASPADIGGFSVHLPDFHKVIANAGGLYVEIDTAADTKYNSTGLLRVHKSGVDPLVGPSDGSAVKDRPLAVGIAWREADRWQPLAGLGQGQIAGSQVTVEEAKPQRVRFSVRYDVRRPAVRAVVETYELTPAQVRVTAELEGEATQLKVRFPVFVFDGERSSRITVAGASVIVKLEQSRGVFEVELPAGVKLHRTGQRIRSRNGYLEAIEGEAVGKRAVYTLSPENAP